MIKSRYPLFKKILILCLLMLTANALLATDGVTKVYKLRYLRLSVTQNYSSFRETRNLLFKGRAQLLNDLISKKVADGKLENLSFYIQIYDAVISRPQLTIRRKSRKCEIIVSGYPSIQQLYSMVAYASTHKKNLEYTGEGAEERVNQFYVERANAAGLLTAHTIAVWSMPGLSLRYTADSLQYCFNNNPLNYPANSNLPLKIKKRFLLFTNDAILVIKQGKQITMLKLQKPASADFDCNISSDWVNICDGGPQNWLYRYSYKQNKFSTNPKLIK